jgi:hypothetical protein
MSLGYLIAKASPIAAIADYLDALPPDHRLHEVMGLGPLQQTRLYRLAQASVPLELDHFVPKEVPDLTEVVHEGCNTFPVLRRFQKRFARPAAPGARLFGYNHGPTLGPLGPGFFVVEETQGNPEWWPRGAVVIDYFQVPDGPVPGNWPRVIRNEEGFQRFVYAGTRDFMRRVSKHVAIGRACKGERPLPSYFVLCRCEDVAQGGE